MNTVRVLAGYESSEGALDPQQARGYWFDDTGKLVKTYFQGIETQRAQFADFGGVHIAHQIKVLQNGALGMIVQVTEVSAPPDNIAQDILALRGHEWKRQFTDETR